MGRVRIAVVGAILTLLVIPSGALALGVGTLDVDVEPGAGYHLSDGVMTQTFTAGLTGQLTQVELYCMTELVVGDVTLSVDSADSSGGQCGSDAMGWVAFTFASPLNVTAGQQYTITFQCMTPTHWGTAAVPYSGGSAMDGDPIADDIAFRTYVLAATPPPTATATGPAAPGGSMSWLIFAVLGLVAASLYALGRRQAGRIG
jgi:hypothetical protein